MEELEPNIHQVPREAPLTVALGIVTAGTAMSENGRSFEHFVSTRTQPLGMGAAGLAAVMWGIGGVFAVLTTVSGLEVTVDGCDPARRALLRIRQTDQLAGL